jgi:hypothetical protein
LVGAVDQPGLRSPTVQRHLERVDDELGTQVVGHRPAHDQPGEQVLDVREVQESVPGRDVGDVGRPDQVRAIGAEVPLEQIGRHARQNPGDTRGTHQPLYALATDADAVLEAQVGADPATPPAVAIAAQPHSRRRRTFLHTVRAVIDLAGQRVSATDRLYLARMIPPDRLGPPRSTHPDRARRGRPAGHCGQPLEIFDDTGYFPQLEQPVHLPRVLIDFIESTDKAEFEFSDQDLNVLRDRTLRRAVEPSSGSADRNVDHGAHRR